MPADPFVQVLGVRRVKAAFRKMRKTQMRRSLMAGFREGAKIGTKEVKKQITLAKIRKYIGWRAMKVSESKEASVKIGASVGKKGPKFHSFKGEKRGKPGVGISKQNIHWWFLGGKNRVTKSGASRGSMRPQTEPVKTSVARVRKPIQKAVKAKTLVQIKKEFEKELAKGRSRNK